MAILTRTGNAVALIAVVASGCRSEGEVPSRSSGQQISSKECEWFLAPDPGDPNVARCYLEFREVVRLEGSLDGVAPDHPVRVLRDGTFVSGTYSRGKLALWAPDGRLLDVLGTGPGAGPGEFGYARSFAQVSDNEFFVFAGQGLVHKYSTAEGFISSFRLPGHGWDSSDAMYQDVLVLSVAAEDGWRAFQLDNDGGFEALDLLLGPSEVFPLLAAAQDGGFWSANNDRYVFRRHILPGGAVVDSLVLSRDWFPDPGGTQARLFGLQADSRGLLWTAVTAPDPDMGSRRQPAQLDAPIVGFEEYEALAIRYSDSFIEAFTPDGRLVASIRFDSFRDAPLPMPGGLWYRPTEDRLSVVILEPILVGRG